MPTPGHADALRYACRYYHDLFEKEHEDLAGLRASRIAVPPRELANRAEALARLLPQVCGVEREEQARAHAWPGVSHDQYEKEQARTQSLRDVSRARISRALPSLVVSRTGMSLLCAGSDSRVGPRVFIMIRLVLLVIQVRACSHGINYGYRHNQYE